MKFIYTLIAVLMALLFAVQQIKAQDEEGVTEEGGSEEAAIV